MKGIRGLLEKDFRLFFRQGSSLFLALAFVALFFILTGKTGVTFIAIYIPSVMAVYSGNTISYDENEHGYTYLFSLPVNRKIYVREKYIFSFIMTVCGWGMGVICAGIMVLIKPGEFFDVEMLIMELITIFVFQAIAGIVIAIRLRFEGEKGRMVLPIAILIIFAVCYTTGHFLETKLELKESISYMIGEIGDFEIAILLSVLSLLVWFASYKYSMRVMKKKEF
ncbi:ABC-2 transporter permease [Ruminococcus hominis]|uniref:ABC-2 transporter permease n=1 Tax=Ruminococcus hominis TaxID=2763065 RepID=A0ABR7G4L3_9FIRM|nr:ABC-2 transporter permease [Ruminococcus hominis]MBC5682364.1 ABC-2 transporter permease [Ruminococcus hominis]